MIPGFSGPQTFKEAWETASREIVGVGIALVVLVVAVMIGGPA